MKKVGIITILKVNNFGAELQAYATQQVINQMGYQAEIIDYFFYKNPLHIRERISSPFYNYPIKCCIKENLALGLARLSRFFKKKSSIIRKQRFEDFHHKYTCVSTRSYRKYSDLYAQPPIYDVYCVGSDQVWNPYSYTNLNPYFLTFAPRESRKFSYASSFGVESLPPTAIPRYASNLAQLDCISVREASAQRLVKDLIGREAAWVADPTLLLDETEWSRVEQPVEGIPEDFVLVYELRPMPMVMSLAEAIACDKGLKVVRLCKDASNKEQKHNAINIWDAGPSEFIYLFRRASIIVTNSFHGTAFSINFQKNFFTVVSQYANNNSRQLNLLSMCGLEERVVYDGGEMPDWNKEVEYSDVRMAVDSFVSSSKKYLRRAIDGE